MQIHDSVRCLVSYGCARPRKSWHKTVALTDIVDSKVYFKVIDVQTLSCENNARVFCANSSRAPALLSAFQKPWSLVRSRRCMRVPTEYHTFDERAQWTYRELLEEYRTLS